MWELAETLEGEQMELINSYIREECPAGANAGVWYLGKSLELMAQADVVIGVDSWDYSGCRAELTAAQDYGIKRYLFRPEYVIDNYKEYTEKLLREEAKKEVPINE